MTMYEELLNSANNLHLSVIEIPMIKFDGLIIGKDIYVRSTIRTSAQKADTLAEEIAHHDINVGNILDQSVTENRKQEHKARSLAYQRRIGLSGIISAYRAKCRNRYEMAEHLETTERFLQEALDYFREKYGISVQYNGYLITFEPNLNVTELE